LEEEEEDKEKEMELEESEAHPKSPTVWAPALKKAHTAAGTQVQLPNLNLPLPSCCLMKLVCFHLFSLL
jgi:hypothetical protein